MRPTDLGQCSILVEQVFECYRVRDLATLDYDVVDRPLTEEVTGGEPGVAGAYDNSREALDGEAPQVTATVTSVGFVSASNTAERFWD